MIVGPKIAWKLDNFKDSFNNEVKGNNEANHHENTASFKKCFEKTLKL